MARYDKAAEWYGPSAATSRTAPANWKDWVFTRRPGADQGAPQPHRDHDQVVVLLTGPSSTARAAAAQANAKKERDARTGKSAKANHQEGSSPLLTLPFRPGHDQQERLRRQRVVISA